MKGCKNWSYRPYRPLLTQVGDPYICRIVPDAHAIHLEWLNDEQRLCVVYCRVRGAGEFALWGETHGAAWDITGLSDQTDYEFYVSAPQGRSRVRLARTGVAIGTVVNYLHPDDDAYSFSGHYLASPSLVRHPDGYLLASMDVFSSGYPQNLTMIFRSDDEGATWHYVSDLFPCFWGKLFIHKGELYMLGNSTEYGDLLIGKSTDGGKTFSAPVALLRGSNAKNGNTGVHRSPQNVHYFGGRLWETLEWGSWQNKEFGHAAMVMSCDENADLLDPDSWSISEPVPFRAFAPELEGLPGNTMTIEGTLVTDPAGRLLNIMRFGKYGKALVYAVNTEDPEAPLEFDRLMDFPANYSKFIIRHDPVSGYWYTVATRVYDPERTGARNLLSLLRSRDLESWEVVTDLIDRRDMDHKAVGFQYVDFEIEGEDILYLCRTGWNGANTYHNTNYQTFHRIQNFRDIR